MLRWMIVWNARSPKCSRTSPATWLASLKRASYMVSRKPSDLQLGIQLRLGHADRVEQLAETFQREILALDRVSTLSAATSALSVTSPSEWEQSIRMKS